jgi:hypothetical protein
MSIEITDWLRGLGLEQYASAFHENAIDAEILRELTADDLKDLGVKLVGHRRKLLAAIAALRPDPGTGAPITSTEPVKPGPDASEAERRQLTVVGALPGIGPTQEWDVAGETPQSRRATSDPRRTQHGHHRPENAAALRQFVRIPRF